MHTYTHGYTHNGRHWQAQTRTIYSLMMKTHFHGHEDNNQICDGRNAHTAKWKEATVVVVDKKWIKINKPQAIESSRAVRAVWMTINCRQIEFRLAGQPAIGIIYTQPEYQNHDFFNLFICFAVLTHFNSSLTTLFIFLCSCLLLLLPLPLLCYYCISYNFWLLQTIAYCAHLFTCQFIGKRFCLFD